MSLGESDPLLSWAKVGQHIVPGIWRYLLPEDFFRLDFPDEEKSTCSNCPRIGEHQYREDYRCCTYHPRVPNYALGLALETQQSRKFVESAINNGFCLPEGSQQSHQQWLAYLEDNEEDRFGRSESVLCPFFNQVQKNCGIYFFRNAVCSTFFCRHDHSDRGERYWNHIQALVGQVEIAIAQWALCEVGFDLHSYIHQLDDFGRSLEKTHDPKTSFWHNKSLKKLWGPFYEKEAELYHACAKVVRHNLDNLWQIANQWQIVEAKQFERATLTSVPAHLEHQIDPSDLEDGDTLSPKQLLGRVKQSHTFLWRQPSESAKLQINPRVAIEDNQTKDAFERQFGEHPYVLEFRQRAGRPAIKWRTAITAEDRLALEHFQKPRPWQRPAPGMDWNPQDWRAFVTKWFAQKVLLPESRLQS